MRLLVLILALLPCYLSAAAQAIFPSASGFPRYVPSCSNSCVYTSLTTVSGDFNGDNKLDFAYLEISTAPSGGVPTPSAYLVVVFGNSIGAPQQVVTPLNGCTPNVMMAADFNQDKKLDVVLNCAPQGFVETLLGNGDGTFQAPILSPAPAGGSGMTVADFNGDGFPDLAFTLSRGYAISLNQNNGQFGVPATHDLGQSVGLSGAIAAGDVNGDGKQDLVFGSGYVLGNGDGTFQSLQALPAGIVRFAVADYNKDGYADIVYSNTESSISDPSPLHLINGSSSGLSSQPVVISGNGFDNAVLQTVSLDGGGSTGVLAFLSSDIGSNGFSLSVPNGSGSLDYPIAWGNVSPFAVADINADGLPDVITMDPDSGQFLVIPGTADGIFSGLPFTVVPMSTAGVADMNGDGLPDAIVKPQGAVGPPEVFLSSGNGRFVAAPDPAAPGSTDNGSMLATADFNGDSHPDVVSIYPGLWSLAPPRQTGPGQIFSYRGNSDGTLTLVDSFTLPVDSVTGAVVGDFNCDGHKDLILSYSDNGGGALFLPGNGDGTFGNPVKIALLGNDPIKIATSDLNGDGKADLVIADGSGTVISYLGNGDGTFVGQSNLLSVSAAAISVTDVTGDGIPDLVCFTTGKAIQIYSGTGVGTFSETAEFTSSPSALISAIGTDIQVADVNGDGLPDIVILSSNATNVAQLTVFLNQGAGNFTLQANRIDAGPIGPPLGLFLTKLNRLATPTSSGQYLDALVTSNSGLTSLLNQHNPPPSASTGVTPTQVALTIANNPKQVVVGDTITVIATMNGGEGTPSGTVSFYLNGQAAGSSSVSQGQASAQVKIQESGSVTITASYGGDATYSAGTGALTFTAVNGTAITLSAGKSSLPQGTPVTLTATVSPATATGTVTFEDGTSTLGTSTLSGGVATFTSSSLDVGSHAITAAYGGDSIDAPSTSSAVSVNVTAATIQVTANPATVTIAAGQTGSTAITVTPVGSYAGVVNFACSGLPAHTTCTFSPATLTFAASSQAAQTSNLLIATNVPGSMAMLSRGGSSGRYLILAATFLLIPLRRRGRLLKGPAVIMVAAGLTLVSSCGGGGGGTTSTSNPTTPVGSSVIAITTGTSAGTFNLTVNITQ